ncbi:MAG: NPCBM/NEW2 domain-containing protein, partial [Pirellulaceae bacterium]
DLEPETIKWTPYIFTGQVNERLTRLYRPRRDRTLSGKTLVLANQSFPKGLAIHSRTEMTYRLTDEFQVFQSLVGIDPALGENGDVDLVVMGNGKQLFRKTITGRDEAMELKIDVRGVSRLTILVDFGEQLDIGDHLLLCNARLIK